MLVQLGDDAEVSALWIRQMLTGEYFKDRPLDEQPYAHFPLDDVLAEVLTRAQTEEKHVRTDLAPLLDWAKQHDRKLMAGDWFAVFERASETEQHAAQRLGVQVTRVKLAARILWDHQLDDERDHRVGVFGELSPRSRQARRGLVTREMLAELRTLLDEAYAGQGNPGASG